MCMITQSLEKGNLFIISFHYTNITIEKKTQFILLIQIKKKKEKKLSLSINLKKKRKDDQIVRYF